MPIATFRGEKSVNEIADRLFANLTTRQREIAASAILRANPQLDNLDRLPNGTVIHVPRLPELRAKTNRGLENPDAQIANDIVEALSTFREILAARMQESQESTREQLKLAGSAAFKRAITAHDGAEALAAELGRALKQRSVELPQRASVFEAAASRIAKDLKRGPG